VNVVNAAALERALAAVGLPGTVEVRGSMALLVLSDEAAAHLALVDAQLRHSALHLAAEHGFTHLALELFDHDDRAPVHRD
jgi:hypothetical protein